MNLSFETLLLRRDGFTLSADFEIASGDRIAVIGPSGGGKSTLLAAVAGFIAPAGGGLRIAGADMTGVPPASRPVSMVFQDNNLFPHLTVAQNVGLGLDPRLRLTAAQRDAVTATLDRVGLSGVSARRPGDLSGGQQSRVALARVLLRRKPVLLLDEPFAALGPALRAEMLTLVEDLVAREAMSLLMVTHDPRDALRIAPLTVLVADGVATAPAPTRALLADPPPALRTYLG